MAKPLEVIRSYKMSDADMNQTSRLFLGQFTEDKELFTGFDNDFNDPFAENMMQLIVTAENLERDLTVTDELVRLTEAVSTEMEKCKTHFQKMKYYIEKAFPNDRNSWNLFGYSEYESARLGETKMLPFMKSLYTQAVKNKTKLIAANYKEEDIEMINTLWEGLLAADQAQEAYKKERPITTQKRIEALNAVWECVAKINKASKIIFADNYAKLQQYVLNDDSPSANNNTPTPPTEPVK